MVEAINQAEIYRFIPKPIQVSDLIQTLRQALDTYDLMEENRRLSALVQTQQDELQQKERALKQFAEQHPALVNVQRDEDGSIIIGKSDI